MGDFSYSKILWVLHHYQELRSGFNPDGQPVDSVIRSKTVSHRAPYENCCLMAGEVAARIKLCGLDGYLVEDRYGMNDGVKHEVCEIARMRHLPVKLVSKRIHWVIHFCEGEGRHAMNYQDWKNIHRFQRRMR